MARNKMVLSICLLCIILLSSCFQSTKYPKYEVEGQYNGQYILTSPDGILYVTNENNIWYPDKLSTDYDYDDVVGRCGLGYIFDTDSEICLFTDDFRGASYTFFLDDIVFPKVSIENINNAVLKRTHDRDSQKIVDEQATEILIELYNNTETHEIQNINRMKRIWELDMECEQFRGLYFMKTIYSYDNDYYMYIRDEYDSKEDITTDFFVKCTSVIELSSKRILNQSYE